MPNYRRYWIPGGTYFFTVNLLDRGSRLLTERIGDLREAVREVRAKRPFRIDCWVVLPDHMHCIWTLPENDADYAGRWRAIKVAFSKTVPAAGWRSNLRRRKGERGIWQRRFWEHTIRNERDYEAHMDYVHYNPVKHGHARKVADWPYSSFHRWVKAGTYPRDWAAIGIENDLPAGERV